MVRCTGAWPDHQVRAVGQHLPKQRPCFWSGILAELASRQLSEARIRRERCRLLTAPVQREHELHVRMLGKRISHDKRADLLQRIMMLPKGEPRVEEPLAHVAALLEQRAGGRPHGRRIRQVDERRVTPKTACFGKQPGGVFKVAAVERRSATSAEIGEGNGVELTRLEQYPVAGMV